MKYGVLFLIFALPALVAASQPTVSLSHAKRILLKEIHAHHPYTVYCNALYNGRSRLTLPEGLDASVIAYRSERVEVEHMVPAENFGRTIKAWKEGHPTCIDSDGMRYNGRRCAEKVSPPFRKMLTDLYNLYPSIGSVNAARQNFPFGALPKSTPALFRSCAFKVEDDTVEPPAHARGVIGRTYLYFEDTYASAFQMTPEMRDQMTAWNRSYPVTAWECTRAFKIEKVQGNANKFVKEPCIVNGLWKE